MKKILIVLLSLSTSATAATDFSLFGADASFSGFATAGFAISDQPYRYQRFINNDGTFKRDSLIGGQIDIKLNDEFSITAQAKVAPALDNDKDIDPMLTWAFLSWRPTNDLLFRGGRLRAMLYMNSQNMDVGTTFDFARLPAEVYFTAPLNDFDGLSINKTWDSSVGEFTFEGYVGTVDPHTRIAPYNYDGLRSDAYYVNVRTNAYGGTLTLQREENIFRIGVHDTYTTRLDDGLIPDTFPFVQIAPNVGYYKVGDSMPDPPIPSHNQVHTMIYTAGIDLSLGYDFRLMGEFIHREIYNSVVSPNSQGGYLAILKSIGDFTPYVSVAYLKSMDETLDLYNRVSQNRLPTIIPGAAQLNAAQRAASATIFAYDQTTWAVGTSYKINSTNKLKAEWAITDTGNVSSFVDTPPNEFSGNRLINVFSLSYSVVF